MTDKKKALKGYIQTPTATIFTLVAFGLGFFAGVAFAVYKTGPQASNRPLPQVQNESAQMIAKFEAEVNQNPANSAAWVQLGHLYFDGNAYSQAINAYEKALQLEPNNPNVMTDLGIMYRRNGEPEKAVAIFSRVIAIAPKHENARFNKGIVMLNDLQDREGALAAWEGLRAINPLAMAPNGQSIDELIQHYKEHVNK